MGSRRGDRLPHVEDWPARIIAAISAVISVISIAVTYALWFRSGPRLKVEAFVQAATGMVHIEVSSTGRLAATVRAVELRDETTLRPSTGSIRPLSRWSVGASVNRTLPADLAPSSYLEGDVPVQVVLDLAMRTSEVNVRAWAQRGDGQWFQSKTTVRVR